MTAAVSNVNLDRLLDQLVALYEDCERRKVQCEMVCLDCREVLKPWPVKHGDGSEDGKSSPGAELKPMTHPQPQSHVSSPGSQEELEITMVNQMLAKQEELEITMVNQMLAKTQKVRKAQEKKYRENIAEALDKEQPGHISASMQVPEGSLSSEIETAEKQTKMAAQNSAGWTNCRVVGSATAGHSVGTSGGKSSGSRTKLAQSQVHSGTISQSQLRKLMEKPTSAGCRTKPTRIRVQPAHVGAPFKTEPLRQRKPVSYSAKSKSHRQNCVDQSQHRVPSGAQRTSLNKGGCDSTSSSNNCASGAFSEKNNIELDAQLKLSSSDVDSTGLPSHNSSKVIMDVDKGHPKSSLEQAQNLTSRLDKISLGNSKVQETTERKEVKKFNLIKEGSTMSIPGKLRRLCKQNVKLQHLVKTSAITMNAAQDNTVERQFVERLKESQASMGTSQSLYDQVRRHICECQHLNNILDTVANKPLTDSSSWKEVLRTRITLEHILRNFTDLEEDYRQIETKLGPKASEGIHAQLPPPADTQLSLWLPKSLNKEPLVVPASLKYQRRKQLLQYTELLYEVQLLQLELFLLDQGANDILPGIKSMHFSDECFLQLYRGLYSVVVTSGQSFPAMVSDTMDNDDPHVELTDQEF